MSGGAASVVRELASDAPGTLGVLEVLDSASVLPPGAAGVCGPGTVDSVEAVPLQR